MPALLKEPTPEERKLINAARAMRCKEGLTWAELGRRFGRPANWLRYRLDPDYNGYRSRRSHEASNGRHEKHSGIYSGSYTVPLTEEELRERLALIPEDTRDYTGRFFGDPIPNDQRRMRNERLQSRFSDRGAT